MIKIIGVLKNQETFDIAAAQQEGREPRRYHGLFSTHPDNDTRLQEVVGEAQQYAQPGTIDDQRAEFLGQTEGLTFGDPANQGWYAQTYFVIRRWASHCRSRPSGGYVTSPAKLSLPARTGMH
jgi:predicted Zn-dependent protease